MSDITINCIYCKKTIKLSYKSRHEKSKTCIQARAKGNITIYLCQHCDEQFSDLDLKDKHEKHLKCDQKILFEKIQILLDEKDAELENVSMQLSEKNDELLYLNDKLAKKQTEINLLKKQKQIPFINQYNQKEQHKLFKQFNRKTQYYVLCNQQFEIQLDNDEPMYVYVQQTNDDTYNINTSKNDIKMYSDTLMLYNTEQINNIMPRIISYLYQHFDIINPLYNYVNQLLGDIKTQYKCDDDDKTYDIDKILCIMTNNLTNDYECKRDNYYILTDTIKQMYLKY